MCKEEVLLVYCGVQGEIDADFEDDCECQKESETFSQEGEQVGQTQVRHPFLNKLGA